MLNHAASNINITHEQEIQLFASMQQFTSNQPISTAAAAAAASVASSPNSALLHSHSQQQQLLAHQQAQQQQQQQQIQVHPSPSPSSVSSSVSAGSDDGTILFIGDLSRSVKEEELMLLFAPFGTVSAIDIKRDKITFNNLGYGFVQFSSRTEAQAAKKALNGFELNMRKIRIGWAQKNTTLFIGDLDGNIGTEDLIRVFEVFGTVIHEESFVKEPSRKYGFVRFGSREDAERAKSEMNHKMLGTRPIRIGWGDSNFEKHCVHVQFDPNATHVTTGANVNSVFHDQFFMETFAPFAERFQTSIVNISLPKHNHSKKLKGFAFVHYEENEHGEKAAAFALQTLTGLDEAGVAINNSSVENGTSSTASNGIAPFVHHLQQSFSTRGGNNSSPPGHSMTGQYRNQQQNGQTPNNNAQQYILAGIPVKYSFGKRQIFSRHRRANENAAALAQANQQQQGLAMQNSMAAMMLQAGMLPSAAAAAAVGGNNGRRGNNAAFVNRGLNVVSNQQALNPFQNNAAALAAAQLQNSGQSNLFNSQFLPFLQQPQAGQANVGSASVVNFPNAVQSNGLANRFTNSVSAASPNQQTFMTNGSPLTNVNALNGGVGIGVGDPAQAQAAQWMIQNLAAAQQFGLPLTVQQVQQAYQQLQQQQQQQQQTHASNQLVASGVGNVYDHSPLNTGNSGPELNDAATNLASAANAFLTAQSQLYYTQQQQQQNQTAQNPNNGIGGLHLNGNTLSQPSHNSMAQLMSEMNSLGIVSPSPSQQSSLNPMPNITSGHNSTATSPSHAMNLSSMQQFLQQQQQQILSR